MGKMYGYATGIARSEKWDKQLAALKNYGVADGFIVSESCGVRDERPRFRRLVTDYLHAGDILVVESLDALGRNQNEIFDTWKELTRNEVVLVILDMPFLNSYQPGDIMRPVMSEIVLRSFEYFAAYKYHAACQRQTELVRAAKERGAKFGRRKKDANFLFWQAVERWRNGEISVREATQELNMSRATFFRRLRELKNAPAESGAPKE